MAGYTMLLYLLTMIIVGVEDDWISEDWEIPYGIPRWSTGFPPYRIIGASLARGQPQSMVHGAESDRSG